MKSIQIKESDFFVAWIVFFLIATVAGGIVGMIAGGIIGFILGAAGASMGAIQIAGGLAGFLIGVPISYLTFRFVVRRFIIEKNEEKIDLCENNSPTTNE